MGRQRVAHDSEYFELMRSEFAERRQSYFRTQNPLFFQEHYTMASGLVRGICGSLISSDGAGRFGCRSRRSRYRTAGRRLVSQPVSFERSLTSAVDARRDSGSNRRRPLLIAGRYASGDGMIMAHGFPADPFSEPATIRTEPHVHLPVAPHFAAQEAVSVNIRARNQRARG